MTMSLKLCAASVVVFTRQTNLMIMNAKGLKSNVTSADTQAQTMKDGTIAMRITAMTNSPMAALNKQARQVQRYTNYGVDMMEWDDGTYVKYSDYLARLDELEAAEKRIAELEAVREVFLRAKALMYQSGGAPIENSLNPIDAWLYDAERAAAGIGVKGE